MASMNMEEQLVDEQQPTEEKPINRNCQEPSLNVDTNGANLAKSAAGMEKELETSTTTTVDLPRSRHRKLPAELNQQIFLCLHPAAQLKFIYGLGWDFYAMFRHKLLTKTKRVRNPHGNRWNGANTRAIVAPDGLNASNNTNVYPNVFTVQPFLISGPLCRADDFPGTICYYYEVKGQWGYIGLSGDPIPYNPWIGHSNSYAIRIPYHYCYGCWIDGETHRFELPEGAIRPAMKEVGNAIGCGIVLDSEDKLAIFFTLNGQVCGRKISISPTVDRLFPAVTMEPYKSLEANFGDDPAKPFEYDIQNCPGLELDCLETKWK